MIYVFAAGRYITWASGRGLDHGNGEFLGPVKWHRADGRVPFGAQKTPHPELIRNQQQTVRCIKGRSGI
jgi:hypothetical protein